MHIRRIDFITGNPVDADEARGMTARLLDNVQPGLVATVMNYHPGTNTTRTAFPVVHFSRRVDGFSLIGFGDIGCCAAQDIAPLLHRHLHNDDTVIHVRSSSVNADLNKRPYMLEYRVPRMVVQTKAVHLEKMNDPVAGAAHLEGLFVRSLERQAQALGIQFPDGVEARFAGAKGTFAAKSNKHKMAKLGLKHAVFEINLHMTGLWAVGYMLSKGYGLINATQQLARIDEVEC